MKTTKTITARICIEMRKFHLKSGKASRQQIYEMNRLIDEGVCTLCNLPVKAERSVARFVKYSLDTGNGIREVNCVKTARLGWNRDGIERANGEIFVVARNETFCNPSICEGKAMRTECYAQYEDYLNEMKVVFSEEIRKADGELLVEKVRLEKLLNDTKYMRQGKKRDALKKQYRSELSAILSQLR